MDYSRKVLPSCLFDSEMVLSVARIQYNLQRILQRSWGHFVSLFFPYGEYFLLQLWQFGPCEDC